MGTLNESVFYYMIHINVLFFSSLDYVIMYYIIYHMPLFLQRTKNIHARQRQIEPSCAPRKSHKLI
jgi:hypothetical protein